MAGEGAGNTEGVPMSFRMRNPQNDVKINLFQNLFVHGKIFVLI